MRMKLNPLFDLFNQDQPINHIRTFCQMKP